MSRSGKFGQALKRERVAERRLEILDDLARDDVRRRQVRGILQRLVA
jgi:hypothetical protein